MPEAVTPAITATGVSVRFGERVALDDVTFGIPAGAFLAVVGPNGSGKSTLLKAMLGLVKPDRGKIAMPGGAIGYVPQFKTLDKSFPARALDVVASGTLRRWPWQVSGRRRDDAMAALEQVDAGRLAEYQVSKLSGGELQRVYLARALGRRPDLILLDEPATGIDAPSEQGVYNVLERFRTESGGTVVMVTHDLSVAFHHATHALLLNSVQIAFGPPEEALDDDSLRLAYGHVGHKHTMRGKV